MSDRRVIYAAAALLLGAAVFVWQLPVLAALVPSRYIARLPLPLQEFVQPDHALVLPTAAAAADPAAFLPPTPTMAGPEANASLHPPLIETVAGATAGVAQPSPSPSPPIATPDPTATPPPATTPIPFAPSARLSPIYHQFQDWNNCGPATLAMTLSFFGLGVNQYQTAELLKPNIEDRNVTPQEMAAYVNEQTSGQVQAVTRTNGTLDTLRRLLSHGAPVIVEVGIDPPGEYAWNGWFGHYLLVVAYDDPRQQVWVYDSWFGTSEEPGANAHPDGRVMSYLDLEHYWRQFGRSYIALFWPEDRPGVEAIIGLDLDDAVMWQAALARAEAEVAAEPENAFLWFNLGASYNAAGDYERAAAAFDQARAIGLPWRMLWYQFGPYGAYYQVGRFDDVIVLADATLETQGGQNVEETYYYKGLALAALGNLAEARRNLQRAVALNPNYVPAVQALAELAG